VTLGIMRAAILRVPFDRLTRSLEHKKNGIELNPLANEERQAALEVGQVIGRASGCTPWVSTCLAQSLTAQRMLQKRGIPGVFYLGAAKDTDVKEKMKAHSWSQCGDVIVTGEEGYGNFKVLSVFGWGIK